MPVARRSLDQRGVVLIVSLLLLVVISVLAVTSLRNAASAESVAGNVRTTELATEAAEIALRQCEAHVLTVMKNSPATTDAITPPPTPTTTPVIWPANDPPRWQNISPTRNPKASEWWDDSTVTMAFPLDLALVNQAKLPALPESPDLLPTYKRPPECMIEVLQAKGKLPNALSTTASFIITARGFGPEVAAINSKRDRPQGTEIWLQSHIQLQ